MKCYCCGKDEYVLYSQTKKIKIEEQCQPNCAVYQVYEMLVCRKCKEKTLNVYEYLPCPECGAKMNLWHNNTFHCPKCCCQTAHPLNQKDFKKEKNTDDDCHIGHA